MNCFLLYKNSEWVSPKQYFDYKSITTDLNLNVLARTASCEVIWDKEKIKRIGDPDRFIENTFLKQLVVPCLSKEDIIYRQDIARDCMTNEEFTKALYSTAFSMSEEWKKLGRITAGNATSRSSSNQNSETELIQKIRVMNLFLRTLKTIREIFNANIKNFRSEGLNSFMERLNSEFPVELEEQYNELLNRISFFVESNDNKEALGKANKPDLTLGFTLGDGLKLNTFILNNVDTKTGKRRDPGSALAKVQNMFLNMSFNSFSVEKTPQVSDQKHVLEYGVVAYIMTYFTPFMDSFSNFFDQLLIQSAFYKGALNLKHHMMRFKIGFSFPTVGPKDTLRFADLKEFIMCVQQRVEAVGNSCDIVNKMLLIVTGANQGGKSTFLRSVGVAQIMMQCGLPVPATRYESGIFPSFFTHFTRREDSAMNSGRLDEELGRMSQIIDNLGESSLVLLNESFATTTEKEGSVIAYDIIKALNEAGVKILTVTHLLSFAQKMYGEMEADLSANRPTHVEFFSAEREDSGRRTFKMIQHAPELTSFGLDLYDDIVKNGKYLKK